MIDNGPLIVCAAIGILLSANIFVTYRMWRNGSYSVGQKLAQTVLVWLMPFVGSFIVWSFTTESSSNSSTPYFDPPQEAGLADFQANEYLFGSDTHHHDTPSD